MSMPALRQPKFLTKKSSSEKKSDIRKNSVLQDIQYVIVTLKDDQKLVVASDSYHGIITVGNKFKCVFCHIEMELDSGCKEKHIDSIDHRKSIEKYPHIAEYSENLIREMSPESLFCTICNVMISNIYLARHLHTETHTQELKKAVIRAATYKPFNTA